MTRGNGTMSRDALMRDVERRSVAAFACRPSAIAKHGASRDWYRDPQLRSMFIGVNSLARHDPGAAAISGQELVDHCKASQVLAGLVIDDMESGSVEQFSASDFDVSTEDGFVVADNVESYCRVLREDARRREITDRIAELSTESDPDAILSGIRGLLQDDRLCGDDQQAQVMSLGELVDANPHLKEELIEGFLRRCEIANVISKSKVGKSWLVYGLLLTMAVGGRLWGRFPCKPGRILLVDCELHPETLSYRLRTVAEAMRLHPEEWRTQIDVLSLRGRLTSIAGLGRILRKIKPGTYDVVVLDPLYRLIEAGTSENDNAAITQVYNAIDQYAQEIEAGFILIHHSTKGLQAGKDVTDVGSGAGAQSRAADAHIVVREHEEENAGVLEAALRSFPPITPIVLRWEFPLWRADDGLDPARLKVPQTRGDQRQQQRDAEGFDAIVAALREHGALTERKLRQATGISKDRLDRLTGIMVADRRLTAGETTSGGNQTTEYTLAEHINGW